MKQSLPQFFKGISRKRNRKMWRQRYKKSLKLTKEFCDNVKKDYPDYFKLSKEELMKRILRDFPIEESD